MSVRVILPGLSSAISLLELADGHSRYGLPVGQKIGPSGQEAVPANLLVGLVGVGEKGSNLINTCGPTGLTSSGLESLLPSLVSKLPMPLIGFLRCGMIWRPLAMPSGPPISRLARSGLTTFGKEFGFLHTPTATQNMAAPSMQKHKCCRGVIVSAEQFCQRMGYPLAWLNAAPVKGSVTPSSHKLQQQ